MSSEDSGLGRFFPGLLGDLLRIMRTDAPLQWELTQQLAHTIASEGIESSNVDPVERIRLEQLLGIAQLHVGDLTGMVLAPQGQPSILVDLEPADWAMQSLESWRPVIESFAGAIKPHSEPSPEPSAGEDDDDGELSALLQTWATTMAPAMLAMQVGSVIGHHARWTLGQYDLVLPRGEHKDFAVVSRNLRAFAADWSIPFDELALWVIARDLALHAIFSRHHVANRLSELIVTQAAGLYPDPDALASGLGETSPGELGDLTALTRLLGDPKALRRLVETPELERAQRELEALVATLHGYGDWVASAVSRRIRGSAGSLDEALRRRRIERSPDERRAEALFGLDLDQEAIDRGHAFVQGVLERGGETELAKLWVVEANLPTPAEVAAPGLWIERVNLDDA